MIFAFINSAILILISLIHFYWAFGGKWGIDAVFPEIKADKKVRPGVIMTILVATIFFLMALLYLEKVQLFSIEIPHWLHQYGTWILAVIFLIRAIGDFKYLGFFKKEKDSKFAEMDTKFYSPLCVILAVNSIIVSLAFH